MLLKDPNSASSVGSGCNIHGTLAEIMGHVRSSLGSDFKIGRRAEQRRRRPPLSDVVENR
jgi:hypothetical protein